MIITNLASGSKGNATLVETNSVTILIDAGLPLSNLKKRLNRTFPKIDVLIVTHTHVDHTKGLKSVIKEFSPVIYTSENNLKEQIDNYEKIVYNKKEQIGTIVLETFNLSHDVPCIGLIIKEDEKELIYITDTGYIRDKILDKIKNKNMYILESNYDEEMLINGKYPFHLKQRIRSPKGHLSNEDCLKYLKKLIGDKTECISLAHLSEENNDPKVVEKGINDLLKKSNKDLRVSIYNQKEITEIVL